MLELLEKRKQRFIYLKSLYKMVDGSPVHTVNHHDIAVQAKLTSESARDAFYYLLNEGLIKAHDYDGTVSITHQGVKAYEAAIINSKEQLVLQGGGVTNNIVQIRGKVSESLIHFGNQTSSLEFYSPEEMKDIGEFVELLKERLPSLDMDKKGKALISTEIKTIERELKAEKPKTHLIVAAMQNLKGALTNSLFDATVRFLLSKLSKLS